MNIEDAILEVDGNSYSGQLNVPDNTTERGILMVPGASHGPFGNVFDGFAEAATKNGHNVARFETWIDREDLEEKTESDFEAEIDAGIEFLQSRGCSIISVVAKSLGGRLVLAHVPSAANRIVLWAPAILFDDPDLTPSITASELAEIQVPVRILQGDEDEVVSVENSATVAEHLPNGEMVELPGENHSFLNDEQRIIEDTLAFLPE